MNLTRSLREPGGPCTKSMEVSESRMEAADPIPVARSGLQAPLHFIDQWRGLFLLGKTVYRDSRQRSCSLRAESSLDDKAT